MRFQILIFSTILLFTTIFAGCSGNPPAANANQSNTVTNAAKTNSNNVFNTTVKTPEQTTNAAPTLTPVVKAYCDAKTKKDEAALRKVYSQATLKYFEEKMKEENEKSLVKYLESDEVSNKLCEARNEKIEGETAVAEIKTEGAPAGFLVKFVKENGEWKLTNESPELKSVKEAANNSNSGK